MIDLSVVSGDYLSESLLWSGIGFIFGTIFGRITKKLDVYVVQWWRTIHHRGAHRDDT